MMMKGINDISLVNKGKLITLVFILSIFGFPYTVYRYESKKQEIISESYHYKIHLETFRMKLEDPTMATWNPGELLSFMNNFNSDLHTFRKENWIIAPEDEPGVNRTGNPDFGWIDFNIAFRTTQLISLLESDTVAGITMVRTKMEGIEDLLNRKINGLSHELDVLKTNRNTAYTLLTLWALVSVLAGFRLIKRHFIEPAEVISGQSEHISKGDFKQTPVLVREDIFGGISARIDKLRQHIRNIGEFVQRIGEGDFNTSDLNIKDDNLLGGSLIQMQKKLKAIAEEDKKRNWVNEGLARFSDILRKHNDDLVLLSDDVIFNLTKYLNINQASLFLLKEENNEPILECISTYAWDRKKYLKEQFGLKENLIGQSILEKDYIYMSDVPDGFVHITSGLGVANPREILIVPLIINDEPQGVIELASFNRFEDHVIEFINKVGENIASTMVGIKTNNRTKLLLKESQEMTQQLKKQEEELRRSTRELSEAKENLDFQLEEAMNKMEHQIRKIEAEKKKNIAILEGCEDGVITFKENGIIDFFNKAAEDIWQVSREQALGKHIRAYIPVEILDSVDSFKVLYVGDGNSKSIDSRTEISIFDSSGQEISVLATLSIGKVDKEITFAFFIQRISVEFF